MQLSETANRWLEGTASKLAGCKLTIGSKRVNVTKESILEFVKNLNGGQIPNNGVVVAACRHLGGMEAGIS